MTFWASSKQGLAVVAWEEEEAIEAAAAERLRRSVPSAGEAGEEPAEETLLVREGALDRELPSEAVFLLVVVRFDDAETRREEEEEEGAGEGRVTAMVGTALV
jgi:hypothetical protein